MKKLYIFIMLAAVMALVSSAAVYADAPAKVNICHIPPVNCDDGNLCTTNTCGPLNGC